MSAVMKPEQREVMSLRPVTREEILELEALMVELAREQQPDLELGCTDALAPVKHHFAPGLYAREIFLPAGLRIVGKIHKTSHLMTVCKGSGIIWNEFGSYEFQAPTTHLTRPGAKNVVWTREDTVIVTYHPTNLTSVADIEREIIAQSYEEFDALYQEPKEMIK